MDLPLLVWIELSGKYCLSGKENVPVVAFSKADEAENFQRYDETHHDWFSWKICNCEQSFLLPIP